MADKFKKIDRRFLLTDSSVNSYGFRLLTSGYQKDEFARNPIGYLMHKREDGVLVKWDNLAVEDDKVYGNPCINLSNAKGQQVVDEIESGFLNAASLGHFVVLEASDDESLKLPNQTGPTVTKWFNRECSLVDIPGNYNSLKLFDRDENEINLADFSNYNYTQMKQIILTPEQLGKLNLKADSTDAAAVSVALEALISKAAEVDGLKQQLAAKDTELGKLKSDTDKKEVESIIATALKEKRITVALGDTLKAQFGNNVAGLKAVVDNIPAYSPITNQIANATDKGELSKLEAKSYSQLDKEGTLPKLKAMAPEVFKAKFKEEYGVDYRG